MAAVAYTVWRFAHPRRTIVRIETVKRFRFFNRKTERLTLAAAYTKTEGVFSQKL
jgi:hypothetical protein